MSMAHPAFAERKSIEQVELGEELAPRFDENGLLPVIVVEHSTHAILMLGHMNDEALRRTIVTSQAHFWSRSREALWRKGEHSGFTQAIEQILIDDDQDAVIIRVTLDGPGSCHVGYHSCFYREIESGEASNDAPARLRMIEDAPAFDAASTYAGLPNPTKL